MGNWTFQIVGNGTYAVEAFFFLSGLLAAYHGMRNVVKHEGKLHVLRTYFVRYMRWVRVQEDKFTRSYEIFFLSTYIGYDVIYIAIACFNCILYRFARIRARLQNLHFPAG